MWCAWHSELCGQTAEEQNEESSSHSGSNKILVFGIIIKKIYLPLFFWLKPLQFFKFIYFFKFYYFIFFYFKRMMKQCNNGSRPCLTSSPLKKKVFKFIFIVYYYFDLFYFKLVYLVC